MRFDQPVRMAEEAVFKFEVSRSNWGNASGFASPHLDQLPVRWLLLDTVRKHSRRCRGVVLPPTCFCSSLCQCTNTFDEHSSNIHRWPRCYTVTVTELITTQIYPRHIDIPFFFEGPRHHSKILSQTPCFGRWFPYPNTVTFASTPAIFFVTG